MALCSFSSIFRSLLIMVVLQGITSGETTNVGAIIDMNSRMGKQQQLAIQIAVQDLRNLNVHYLGFNGNPLQTSFEAEELIKDKHVQVVLVCMDDWQATALVAQVGSQAKVPVLSLAASPPLTLTFPSLRWPFLLQMAHNATQQITNIASIIHKYNWRRVIVVYEDNPSGGDSGTYALLNESLQSTASQIECKLVLPSVTSVTNPAQTVRDAITNLGDEKCYSRVFIVLKVSLPYIIHLFKEAKDSGLMGNDSAWITTEAITSFLPSLDAFTLLDMDGVLGIMTKVDNSTLPYQVFQARFGIKGNFDEPSFYALLAYDAVTTISNAMDRLRNTTGNTTSEDVMGQILNSNFTGLTGKVQFDQDHIMLEQSFTNVLVNIIGAGYQEVLDLNHDNIEDDDTAKALASQVTWPGSLNGDNVIPKGWAMPNRKKPMQLGVPVAHLYRNFISYGGTRCNSSNTGDISNDNKSFSGFSIDIFKNVQERLPYFLPYDLIPYCGSYDDLVYSVYNKTFDGAVGDITILANRTELVDFTLPYQESGLSIIRPAVEPYNSRGALTFLEPFTSEMWVVTLVVFIWTMIIIWVLEHGDNSEFRGSWRNQINAAVWFAFNSLYFAQREKISSKLARVVVIFWLFIVLVLTTSYTANLTSMLTNERLHQNMVDAEMLMRTNAKVGYDNSSFVKVFLENTIQFDPQNIIGIDNGDFKDLHQSFKAGNITAAFLEVVYAKLFLVQYCNKYTISTPVVYRYGGLGYVFPKGSPVAKDVSQAILKLTESGKPLRDLENKWLNTSSKCISNTDDNQMSSDSDGDKGSLSLKSFGVLFGLSFVTSTICLLASFVARCRSKGRRLSQPQNVVADYSHNHHPTTNILPLPISREIQMY